MPLIDLCKYRIRGLQYKHLGVLPLYLSFGSREGVKYADRVPLLWGVIPSKACKNLKSPLLGCVIIRSAYCVN